MIAERELLTIDEAAQYLKVCRKTLYRWLRAGRLQGYRVGRQWRLRQADLDRWLEENRAGGELGEEGLGGMGEKGMDEVSVAEPDGEDLAMLEEIRERVRRVASAGQTLTAEEIVAMIDLVRQQRLERVK